ncbi:MAG: DUF6268 family outer membrane beta-barrel protein, partial [Verrucomicrobiales bacterium]
ALPISLHELTLPNFLLYQPEGSRWFHGFYNNLGLRSDFESIDSRDFFLSAAIGSGYQFNETFILGFGVYASDITNEPWLVPAPVFVWMPTPEWLVTYYGPKFIARKEFGDNTRFGFEASWNGGSWNIDTVGGSLNLDVSSLRTGLFWKQRIHKELWAEIGAGLTLANELTVTSPGGRDLFPNTYGTMDAAPYVSLGISVNRW